MHWFDDFAKQLAGGNISRKEMLARSGQLGAGALVTQWLSASPLTFALAPPQLNPNAPAVIKKPVAGVPARKGPAAYRPWSRNVGACNYAFNRGASSGSFGASSGDLTMRMSAQTQIQGSQSRTHSALVSYDAQITKGGAAFVSINAQFGPFPLVQHPKVGGAITITYGPAAAGLRSAEIRVVGGTVSGTVNGRAFVPFPLGTVINESSIRYADGQPAPVINDPALRAAVARLASKVQASANTCRASVTAPHAARGSDGVRLANASATDVLPAPSIVAEVEGRDAPNQWTSNSCGSCQETCAGLFTTCMAGAAIAAASAFLCPPCAAAAAAIAEGCVEGEGGCIASCFTPGFGCCKTSCSYPSCCGDDGVCCGSGDNGFCCYNSEICVGGNACCPSGSPVLCGNTCYASDYKCCGDTGYPNDYTCCGKNGCNTSQFCADPNTGTCCPNGTTYTSVDQTCCQPANACRGQLCCSSGEKCWPGASGKAVCCWQPPCGDSCCVQQNSIGCNQTTHQCGVGVPCGTTFCGFGEKCVNGNCVTPPPPKCGPSTTPGLALSPCPYTNICCDLSNADIDKRQICCATVCCRAKDQCCVAAGVCGPISQCPR